VSPSRRSQHLYVETIERLRTDIEGCVRCARDLTVPGEGRPEGSGRPSPSDRECRPHRTRRSEAVWTPAPDPAPSSRAPVTYVAYDYWAPAANSVTHELLPGQIFKCHVTANGKRFCVLFTRAGV